MKEAPKDYERRDNVLWHDRDPVPFCPHCYEKANRAFQLVVVVAGQEWLCTTCGWTFRPPAEPLTNTPLQRS